MGDGQGERGKGTDFGMRLGTECMYWGRRVLAPLKRISECLYPARACPPQVGTRRLHLPRSGTSQPVIDRIGETGAADKLGVNDIEAHRIELPELREKPAGDAAEVTLRVEPEDVPAHGSHRLSNQQVRVPWIGSRGQFQARVQPNGRARAVVTRELARRDLAGDSRRSANRIVGWSERRLVRQDFRKATGFASSLLRVNLPAEHPCNFGCRDEAGAQNHWPLCVSQIQDRRLEPDPGGTPIEDVADSPP